MTTPIIAIRRISVALSLTLLTAPAVAQRDPGPADQVELSADRPEVARSISPLVDSDQIAPSSAGRAGQRQTRGQDVGGIRPMIRVESRVANRFQNRIRNRLDRYYDPRANALSPFTVAGEEVKRGNGSRRR